MQRKVSTHVGLTHLGLTGIKVQVAKQNRSLTGIRDVFSDWATKTATQLNEQMEKVESAASALGKTMQEQGERIDQKIVPILANLELQVSGDVGRPLAPKRVTPQAMQCIRVLAQAQDLVTDKDFVLTTNNETLKKIQDSDAHRDCVERITDKELREEFIKAFASFRKSNDLEERSERLLLIQRLNNKLMHFFAR